MKLQNYWNPIQIMMMAHMDQYVCPHSPHVYTEFNSRFHFRLCFDWPGTHPAPTIKTQKLEAAMVLL